MFRMPGRKRYVLTSFTLVAVKLWQYSVLVKRWRANIRQWLTLKLCMILLNSHGDHNILHIAVKFRKHIYCNSQAISFVEEWMVHTKICIRFTCVCRNIRSVCDERRREKNASHSLSFLLLLVLVLCMSHTVPKAKQRTAAKKKKY